MTTPMPPFGDQNNDLTRPMPESPYKFDTGTPPPPPPRSTQPVIWGDAPTPSVQSAPPVRWGDTPLAHSQPKSSNRVRSSTWGLAIVLLISGSLLIIGVANASNLSSFIGSLQQSSAPTAAIITATTQPASTATPTPIPPTATIPPTSQAVPDGYQSYTSADNAWTVNIPDQASFSDLGSVTIAGTDMSQIKFSISGHQYLTVFYANTPIDVSNLQNVFNDLISITHASSTIIIQQPYASTIGNYPWYLVKYRATIKNQTTTNSFAIVSTTQSAAILLFQSPPDMYADGANTLFTPALKSFSINQN